MSNCADVCDFDVAIVGAGAAGMVAAYQLQQTAPFLKVILLEAKGMICLLPTGILIAAYLVTLELALLTG